MDTRSNRQVIVRRHALQAESRNQCSFMSCFLLFVFCLLGACAPIQMTRPVTKLGLVAPFEGKQRAAGYEILYAVKLALRERNSAEGVAGWLVELVALNAENDEQRAEQAHVLGVDPEVTVVLVWRDAASRERVPARYQQLGLPVFALDAPNTVIVSDASFISRYTAISNGVAPTALALNTYTTTQAALKQIEQSVRTHGKPTRGR
jgi:ABC-type branched-subunit amino acid transport system substrate-binding protein